MSETRSSYVVYGIVIGLTVLEFVAAQLMPGSWPLILLLALIGAIVLLRSSMRITDLWSAKEADR